MHKGRKKTCAITTTYSASCVMCQTIPKAHNYAMYFDTLKCVNLCQCVKNQRKKHPIKGAFFQFFKVLITNLNPSLNNNINIANIVNSIEISFAYSK